MHNLIFVVLLIFIGFILAPSVQEKLEAPILRAITKIKERRESLANQKKTQKTYKLLWLDANRLMCTLPSSEALVTEVTLKTLLLPVAESKEFVQRAEKYAADIYRIQARYGRLKKRASTHPPDTPFTSIQTDELQRLKRRMEARIQDVEFLYRSIDRYLIKQRKEKAHMPR
ncbi:MAG TPA: hypothetical protein VF281_04010 [Candidatus Saccharimonadales bacterium]